MQATVVRQVLKRLVEEGRLPQTSLFRLALRKPKGTRTYCYSVQEVEAIIEHCRADSKLLWLADVAVALAWTGFRIGEPAALRWGDVDFKRGVLSLRDTTLLARKLEESEVSTTKSHRDRTPPIHPSLRAVLEAMERHRDGLVFHGPRGGRIKPDTVRRILVRDVLRLLAKRFPPVDGRDGIAAGRLHGFRHFFHSHCADNGVPEQMLMAWLGHSDAEMVRHYYYRTDERPQRQMDRLPGFDQSALLTETARVGD